MKGTMDETEEVTLPFEGETCTCDDRCQKCGKPVKKTYTVEYKK